jgi:hypothetical protein
MDNCKSLIELVFCPPSKQDPLVDYNTNDILKLSHFLYDVTN